MKTYVIGNLTITDPERYQIYAAKVRELVSACGGRFVVWSTDHQTFEGDWRPNRLLVIEFPSRDIYDRFFHSAEYQAIIPVRQAASTGSLLVVDGLPEML